MIKAWSKQLLKVISSLSLSKQSTNAFMQKIEFYLKALSMALLPMMSC